MCNCHKKLVVLGVLFGSSLAIFEHVVTKKSESEGLGSEKFGEGKSEGGRRAVRVEPNA